MISNSNMEAAYDSANHLASRDLSQDEILMLKDPRYFEMRASGKTDNKNQQVF